MNGAADAWASASATAHELVAPLVVGDYVCEWGDEGVDDAHALGDLLMSEIRAALALRDLTTATDDVGVRIVAREIP